MEHGREDTEICGFSVSLAMPLMLVLYCRYGESVIYGI
jgi:hypothetical protein